MNTANNARHSLNYTARVIGC